ncbi:MAG TPA: F0F1 ATP synthase subunit B [Candidatus Saccharimonadales bacterium]
MQAQFIQFASAAAEPEKETILEGLGIDFTLLILQGIAFLLMVFVLAKWVYPVFMRIIDEREKKIEESTKAAESAKEAAEKAEANVEAELKKARREAADIVATAKTEATSMVEKASVDAKTKAERIVAEAKESIEKDVIKARADLKKDTLKLVKEASSLATAAVADSKLDAALIKKSVEGAEK